MNIQELREARTSLETRLAREVNRMLDEFYTSTGVAPSSVSIYLAPVFTIGSQFPRYVVTNVEARIEV